LCKQEKINITLGERKVQKNRFPQKFFGHHRTEVAKEPQGKGEENI
jgi:hypothetical protein